MPPTSFQQARHVGALVDITSSYLNTSQPSEITKSSIASLASISNVSQVRSKEQQTSFQALYNTPSRSNMLHQCVMETPPSPSNITRPRSTIIRASSSLRTPFDGQTQRDISGSQMVAIIDSRPVTPAPDSGSSRASQLNKKLPPKPILRNYDSPDHRGIYDTADGASQMVAFKVVEPETTNNATTSKKESFNITTIISVTGHPAIHIANSDVCGPSDVQSPGICDVSQLAQQPTFTMPTSGRYTLSAPRTSEKPLGSPSLDHISTHKDGSPIMRKSLPAKYKRASLRGHQALSQAGQTHVNKIKSAQGEILVPRSGENNELKVASMRNAVKFSTAESGVLLVADTASYCTASPVESDDHIRRSEKYDIGLTIRYSTDAHDMIMGDPIRHVIDISRECEVMKANQKFSSKISSNVSGNGFFRGYKKKKFSKQDLKDIIVEFKTPTISHQASRDVSCTVPSTRGSSSSHISHLTQSHRETKASERRNPPSRTHNTDSSSTRHPPRSTSLANSPEPNTKVELVQKVYEKLSITDRLARPTAASAAREAESKSLLLIRNKSTQNMASSLLASKSFAATVSKKSTQINSSRPLRESITLSSVKRASQDIKSRISSIMPRRRGDQARVIEGKTQGYSSLDSLRRSDKEKLLPAVPHSEKITPLSDNILYDQISATKHPCSAFRNLKAFEDSGLDQSPSNNINADAPVWFAGEEPNKQHKLDQERNIHDRDIQKEENGMASLTTEFQVITNDLNHGSSGGGGEEPPTPPHTRDGPQGHHGIPGQTEDAAASHRGDAVEDYVEQLVREAEGHLRRVIEASGEVTNQGTRESIVRIVETLGAAIQASRDVRMAAIAQSNANAQLALATQQLGGIAAATVAVIHNEAECY